MQDLGRLRSARSSPGSMPKCGSNRFRGGGQRGSRRRTARSWRAREDVHLPGIDPLERGTWTRLRIVAAGLVEIDPRARARALRVCCCESGMWLRRTDREPASSVSSVGIVPAPRHARPGPGRRPRKWGLAKSRNPRRARPARPAVRAGQSRQIGSCRQSSTPLRRRRSSSLRLPSDTTQDRHGIGGGEHFAIIVGGLCEESEDGRQVGGVRRPDRNFCHSVAPIDMVPPWQPVDCHTPTTTPGSGRYSGLGKEVGPVSAGSSGLLAGLIGVDYSQQIAKT